MKKHAKEEAIGEDVEAVVGHTAMGGVFVSYKWDRFQVIVLRLPTTGYRQVEQRTHA